MNQQTECGFVLQVLMETIDDVINFKIYLR